MRPIEVTSIGEAFIDFVSPQPSNDLSTAKHFMKNAGGAPANVAVGLARLGIRTAFVGKVGRDSFGRFVKNELKRYGVETRWIVGDPKYKTRLAFVAVAKNGDRDFEFWENDPADQHLLGKEIDLDAICRSKIINIGPFLLLNAVTKKAAFSIARTAKKRNRWICFDPNIRMSLWRDKTGAIAIYQTMIRKTNVLRLNEDEAQLLTGEKSLKDAVKALLLMGPQLVVVTKDKKGCLFATRKYRGDVQGFSVDAADTTGCGDGFLAGLLAGIIRSQKPLDNLSHQNLIDICTTANAVGALVATKQGAIAAMPSLNRVKQFLRRQK